MRRIPSDIYGCILRDGYNVARADANDIIPSLKGRSRIKPRDDAPVYVINLNFDISPQQMADFHGWWRGINYGADWFLLDVDVDGVIAEKEVHALEPFSARLQPGYRWLVSMRVEAKA